MRSSITEIPVIYFHSVAPSRNLKWARNYLTLELNFFERFLIYLRENSYETIFFEEYNSIRFGGKKQVKKVCVLTFDDGYVDNYIYVWPLLKKYGFKGTIFISPEYVDNKRKPALTLDDVYNGKSRPEEVEKWGYLSWDEMRIMYNSGVIDIQSHTLTHTKYFVSDRLTGFQRPGYDCLYPAGNLFPDRRPYYIDDPGFETILPYGYPFFEERSAVIAKIVEINPEFMENCIKLLEDFDFARYDFDLAFSKIRSVYFDFKDRGRLVIRSEDDIEYRERVRREIFESKRIIEENLNKRVTILCWPHGDNNEFCQKTALEAGYLLTTRGNAPDISPDDPARIGERMGISYNGFRKRLKTAIKLKALSGKFPYRQAIALSRRFKSQ